MNGSADEASGVYTDYGDDMSIIRRLTALIERDEEMYVALCTELDIASQGSSIEEARANLVEAVELFFETASEDEIRHRLHGEVYVTPIEVKVA